MKKTTITMDELFREMARLAKIQHGDRPAGYFTVDEAANELFRNGKSCSVNAARQKVFRSLQDLKAMGRLESLEISTITGITNKRHRATAFKILPEKRTLRKR